jgi:hypothetical protein
VRANARGARYTTRSAWLFGDQPTSDFAEIVSRSLYVTMGDGETLRSVAVRLVVAASCTVDAISKPVEDGRIDANGDPRLAGLRR